MLLIEIIRLIFQYSNDNGVYIALQDVFPKLLGEICLSEHDYSKIKSKNMRFVKKLNCTFDICEASDDEMKSLTNLKYLDCSNSNSISDQVIMCMSKLKTLICVNTGITYKGIRDLEELEYLDCTNTNMSDKGVRDLVKLEHLYCSNTEITYKGIRDLVNLKYLNCSKTPMTDEGFANLTKLQSLTYYCCPDFNSFDNVSELKMNHSLHKVDGGQCFDMEIDGWCRCDYE